MSKYSHIIVLLLLLIGCQTPEQPVEKSFDQLTNLIDQYGNDAIKKGNLDAVAVSIYKDGKTYHNYYGELEKGKRNLPNDSTLFEIASISKVFLGSFKEYQKSLLNYKKSLELNPKNKNAENYIEKINSLLEP